jgi:hypothetical protein
VTASSNWCTGATSCRFDFTHLFRLSLKLSHESHHVRRHRMSQPVRCVQRTNIHLADPNDSRPTHFDVDARRLGPRQLVQTGAGATVEMAAFVAAPTTTLVSNGTRRNGNVRRSMLQMPFFLDYLLYSMPKLSIAFPIR